MARERSLKPLLILIAALAVNLLVFGLAPLMTSGRGAPQDITDPVAVSLVSLAPPEPPQREEIKEPEKPKPEPKPEFKPDLFRPQLSLGDAGLGAGVAIEMGNLGGLDQQTEFVFEAYELDHPPQVIMRVPPIYPYKAREQGVEGVVQVKLLINQDGSVGQVLILDARPKGLFEDAVNTAVPQWKFSPGKIDGQAVTAWVVTFVRFTLD